MIPPPILRGSSGKPPADRLIGSDWCPSGDLAVNPLDVAHVFSEFVLIKCKLYDYSFITACVVISHCVVSVGVKVGSWGATIEIGVSKGEC